MIMHQQQRDENQPIVSFQGKRATFFFFSQKLDLLTDQEVPQGSNAP